MQRAVRSSAHALAWTPLGDEHEIVGERRLRAHPRRAAHALADERVARIEGDIGRELRDVREAGEFPAHLARDRFDADLGDEAVVRAETRIETTQRERAAPSRTL